MTDPTPKNQVPPRVSLFGRLRAYFFTGLAITAPIAITIWATLWFINIFDRWLQPYIPNVYNPNFYLPFNIPGFGLIFALISITLIGALAANLVGRTLLGLWENLLNRTPVVRSIYKGSKQIFETLFLQKGASFQKVCLVEWPRKGIFSLAFISRDVDGSMIGLERGRAMYAIYVSTTPNPTGGYVFFADVGDVKVLSTTVEDALKLIISMGLVFPDAPLAPDKELQVAQRLPAKKSAAKKKSL